MPDNSQGTSQTFTDDDIRMKAYELWAEEGMPEGKHDEHWQRAKMSLNEANLAETSLVTDSPDKSDASSSSSAQPNDDAAPSTVTPMRKPRKATTAS